MTTQTETASTDGSILPRTITVGGTAMTQFVPSIGAWIVAMSGDFEGGVYARIAAGPKDLGNGKVEYALEHFFIRNDGSTLSTQDVAVVEQFDGVDRLLNSGTYTVVGATGAFQGMRGTLRSWGSSNPITGEGILRFWGTLEAQ